MVAKPLQVRKRSPENLSALVVFYDERLAVVQIAAPGDSVVDLPEKGEVRVGTGILQEGNNLITCRPGLLCTTQSGKVWVAGRAKRYSWRRPSMHAAVRSMSGAHF